MINGDYIMVLAPEDYPYKKYRDKYCYEHILIYWKEYGYIPEGYHIHHKNDDKHDNRIDNLIALSPSEHTKLHNLENGIVMVDIMCPFCNLIFSREKRQTFLSKPNNSMTMCSRSCSGKMSHIKLSKEDKIKIGENSIIRIYNTLDSNNKFR